MVLSRKNIFTLDGEDKQTRVCDEHLHEIYISAHINYTLYTAAADEPVFSRALDFHRVKELHILAALIIFYKKIFTASLYKQLCTNTAS